MGLSMLILAPVFAAVVIGACFAVGKLFSRGGARDDD